MPWAISQELIEGFGDYAPSTVFGLFSGGHDSLCSTHIASQMPNFAGVIHANTGIGIEQTRVYVRDTCERFGWPLIEGHPDQGEEHDKTYHDLIMDPGPLGGFPGGPRSHMRHYYYLKERTIARVVREHKQDRRDCVGLVTGIRSEESVRRMAGAFARDYFKEGGRLWLNPILDWTEKDKNAYMRAHALPRNPVVDTLHRSGECLCGALTAKDEFREIELWYPQMADKIRQLEAEVQKVHPDSYWGRRGERENPDQLHFLPLCVGCEARVGATVRA